MHPRTFATTTPDKPALIMEETGETITFAQLEARANRGAHAFRALGIGTDGTVSLVCENRAEYFDIVWAAQRSGIMLVVISSRLKAEEIAYIVNDSGSTHLLIGDDLAQAAADLAADPSLMPGLKQMIAVGALPGLESWSDLVVGQPETPIADEQIGLRMAYSSGTTGRPKGVRLPRIPGPPEQDNPGVLMFQAFFGFDDKVTYLSPAPLYHSAPLGYCTVVQSLGGTVVCMKKFTPERFLAAIEHHKVTVTQCVPTMFIRLLRLSEEERGKHDLSSLEKVIHAAAPCPVPVKRAMIEWLGPIVHEYYAGSEGNMFVLINSEDWLAHPGSVGRPMYGTIRICNDEGDELPVGETGTIYVEGGRDFEYHNDPAKTASSRNPKHPGWTTLGDVGRLDADGFLYLSDRKHFMIISGGVNIYPQEVEDLLITHPEVADVAVFGVPNDDFGEEVKAVVQPADWNRAGPDFEAELIAWCRARLADVKCPRSVDFEREMPRAETGKLYKKELKARYWPQESQPA
jgi:long-chain acyl-CoA synthetase